MKALRNTLLFLGVIGLMFLMTIASLMRPDIPLERLLPDYTDETSAFLEIDGMRVHYRDEGSGPAILLIHGTFASLHTWDDWTVAMRDSFRVVRIDLPGFGLTGPNPDNDYGTRSTLYVLEQLRKHLEIERWSIAGNSLGGRYALDYARYYPQFTDKLILLNAAIGRLPDVVPSVSESDTLQGGTSTQQNQPQSLRMINHPRVRNLLTVLTPRAVIQLTLKEVYASDDLVDADVVQRYFELLRREGNRTAFLTRNEGPTADRSHIPLLPADPRTVTDLQLPVLIMWGEKDSWIRVELGRMLHERMPESKLIVYENAGHVPMEEIPAETSADARRFLLRDFH
ncbi:MAG: alpha/beta hydrolase [Bacteroidetes bacterium]|nr:alpha/beta hydrolase [Bacteroidota bacterium]MCH8524234.1 alpha/beta hydrolase [Balneolales bacterium]